MKKTLASLVLAVIVGAGACGRPVEVKITPPRTEERLKTLCRPHPEDPQYEARCRDSVFQEDALRYGAELHARAVCADPSLPHECERLRAALVKP